jgi:hypothetical protein
VIVCCARRAAAAVQPAVHTMIPREARQSRIIPSNCSTSPRSRGRARDFASTRMRELVPPRQRWSIKTSICRSAPLIVPRSVTLGCTDVSMPPYFSETKAATHRSYTSQAGESSPMSFPKRSASKPVLPSEAGCQNHLRAKTPLYIKLAGRLLARQRSSPILALCVPCVGPYIAQTQCFTAYERERQSGRDLVCCGMLFQCA